MRNALAVFGALALAALTGCTPVRYITQAAAGQEDLNRRGVAIDEIVGGGHLDKRTRGLLAHVKGIKTFGERYGLAHTKSYSRYVWLNRQAVVWVVSACDPLAWRPRKWSFPIVGSITYTGWFDRAEARAYAADLAKEGLDVDVRPSEAYSTLGWFDDPILSTMIDDGEAALGELADVILHETLHATFYVPGQSTLNESVASFVGQTLALRYLEETLGPGSPIEAAYRAARAKSERRGKRMKETYAALTRLYASPLGREEKLAEKRRILDDVKRDLDLKRPLNNASLIQYKTYGSGRDEMVQLLGACGGDFSRMMKALERLRAIAKTSRPHEDPALLLRPVIAGGC